MFTQGFGFASKPNKQVFTVIPVGMLHLPSGRLVAGDAIATLELASLSRTVAPGIYSVDASIATVSADESRMAGVRIVFTQEPVVSWEVASGGSLAASGFTGPTGIFIDAQLLPALEQYIADAASPDEWYYDPPKIEGKRWEVACFAPDDDRPETCVIFETNSYNSDGPYLTYWGLAANGTPAMLVVDVNLVASPTHA